jgi:hypothetical protein
VPGPDMAGLLSSGQGEAPPIWVGGRRLVLAGWGVVTKRVVATRVSLICAGWLPQDGAFGWSGSACLESSVSLQRCS